MPQDEKWRLKYNEVVALIEKNKRDPVPGVEEYIIEQ